MLDPKERGEKIKRTGEYKLHGNRGRVVKASDSKSDSLWERRFESCRLRRIFEELEDEAK